jgi:membrane-bound serine protease (ClpP class)
MGVREGIECRSRLRGVGVRVHPVPSTPNLDGVRRLQIILVGTLLIPLVAFGQEDGGGIDVVDVSGPLDDLALQFIADSIEQAADRGQELVLIQLNSRAVISDEDLYYSVQDLVGTPPLPVAVWVGPAPASAFGGAGELAYVAGQSAISPGSEIGRLDPDVLGQDDRNDVVLEAEQSGLELQPTLRQYLQDLDGRTFQTISGETIVETIRPFGDGVTLKEVTFRKPGLVTRFFRLGASPEATFFFLVVGLAIAIFEFYALGPGVAAVVAAPSLMIGGWGLVNLPTRLWALALVLGGFVALTAAHQRGRRVVLAVIGAGLIQAGGTYLIDGGGQIDPRWWLIGLSVAFVLFFFLVALPIVQRARLSTDTIGRESLVGELGVAKADFDPDGYVEVRGAMWRATAHREAGIREGDDIVVGAVDGLYLEVDRSVTKRET